MSQASEQIARQYAAAAINKFSWGNPNGINVKAYGAVGDGSTDDTAAIQVAINYAKTIKSFVYFPAGTYMITQLLLFDDVDIWGAGQKKTILKALSSNKSSLICIGEHGPIQKAIYSGFTLDGANGLNSAQNGLYLDAVPQDIPFYNGGIWYSHFENITIQGFAGSQIYLNAIDGLGDVANQFLRFVNVNTYRLNTVDSRCLTAYGQLGQTVFESCQLDGPNNGQNLSGSTNVYLGRKFQVDGITPVTGTNSPACIMFVNCTSQNGDIAFLIDKCNGITFDTCWLENVNRSFKLTNNSQAVTIDKCRFANASGDGTIGYGVFVGDGCTANITNNVFAGTQTFLIDCGGSHLGVTSDGNRSGGGDAEVKTRGVVKQLSESANRIGASYCEQVIVNNTTNTIQTLDSLLETNKTVTVRAFQASAAVKFGITGNITLPGTFTLLTLAQHQAASFIKSDLGANKMVLVHTTGTLS